MKAKTLDDLNEKFKAFVDNAQCEGMSMDYCSTIPEWDDVRNCTNPYVPLAGHLKKITFTLVLTKSVA